MKGTWTGKDVDHQLTLAQIIDAHDYAQEACRDQDLEFTPALLLGFLLGLRYCAEPKSGGGQ